MSAMIMLLMIWKYTPTEKRKLQEHVKHDCAAHEIEIRTS